MNFGIIILNQSIKTIQNYATLDTDSFIINIKTEDFSEDIADDIEKRYDTSNYKVNMPLSKGKNKKLIGLMKDELGGKIMIEFVSLRPKVYFCLMDDDNSDDGFNDDDNSDDDNSDDDDNSNKKAKGAKNV